MLENNKTNQNTILLFPAELLLLWTLIRTISCPCRSSSFLGLILPPTLHMQLSPLRLTQSTASESPPASSSLIRSLCLMTVASSVGSVSVRKGERRNWMTNSIFVWRDEQWQPSATKQTCYAVHMLFSASSFLSVPLESKHSDAGGSVNHF